MGFWKEFFDLLGLNTPDLWSLFQAAGCISCGFLLFFLLLILLVSMKSKSEIESGNFFGLDGDILKFRHVVLMFEIIYFLTIVVIPFVAIYILKPAPLSADSMTFLQKVFYYTNADTYQWWHGWQWLIFFAVLFNWFTGLLIIGLGDRCPDIFRKFPYNIIWPRKLITFALLVLCYDGLLYSSKWVLEYLGLPWHPMG